jgi:hypothetical protein
LLHQGRRRVAVGCLSVWIDRYRAVVPDFSLRRIPFLHKHITREKRCMVKLWIKLQRFLVIFQRLVEPALRKEGFGLSHQTVGPDVL